MNYRIFTLGCKVNQAESSGLAQLLERQGLQPAAAIESADILLINSCAVTAESVRKAKQLLRSLRRKNPKALLLLTGCWPQAFPNDDFADADFVTGTKDRAALLTWIAAAKRIHPTAQTHCITSYAAQDAFSELPCADTTRTRAFLKIQDGCNQFCSYCIIPYARGRCRSMPHERLRQEVETLAAQGFREIVLTGINLGFYGIDTAQSLADAVNTAAAPDSILRVRLGSLEPERMTSELLAQFAACEKFCPQFHLSLQSGVDTVLSRMRRRYDTAQYRALAEQIRRLFPHAALTTDVIVGFPGETDAEFEQTCAFVQEIGFAKIHVFPYSPREGTKAAAFPNQIAPAVKSIRAARLGQIADALRNTHLAAYVGQTVPVLVEAKKRQNAQSFYQGHTPDGTLVKIFPKNEEKGLQNALICVTIESYEGDACIGQPSSNLTTNFGG